MVGEQVTTSLCPGDRLLLFDQALDSLLGTASEPVGRLADYADHLLDHTASNTGDDACLVAVQVR